MALGAVVGAVAAAGSVVSSIFGNRAEKKARKQAEQLARQKKDLYSKLTESNIKKATQNYEQIQGTNLLNQSVSGIDLDSGTYQQLNKQTYRDFLQDIEQINLQQDFYNLGVESEIASINARKPSFVQESLQYLNSGLGGFNAGYQVGNKFKFPS